MSTDSGTESDVSETTKAVLRIQQQLEDQDAGKSKKSSKSTKSTKDADGKKEREGGRGSRRRRDDSTEEAMGDGRTTGSITGIKLGEFAPGAKRGGTSGSTGGGGVRMKGKGKGGGFGQSLESLAAQEEREDGAQAVPEAPAGTVKRKDAERAAAQLGEKPTKALGIDGKEYAFLEAPSDEEKEEPIKKASEGGKKRKVDDQDGSKKKSKKDKKSKKKGKKKDKKDKEKSSKKHESMDVPAPTT
mmetsp:Transcript_66496/g.144406  ORF Transcript_66496/g.144406 Transcript_66496/m.144406 type:complete len:244 (-) Transcript_66496:380-1111(-)